LKRWVGDGEAHERVDARRTRRRRHDALKRANSIERFDHERGVLAQIAKMQLGDG
jgi:hypothetical protein